MTPEEKKEVQKEDFEIKTVGYSVAILMILIFIAALI